MAALIVLILILLTPAFCVYALKASKKAELAKWKRKHAKSVVLHEERIKAYWDAEPARQAAREKADAEHKAYMKQRLDERNAEMKRKRDQS
ncbi:hypothetical protein FV222_00295 [Methylobacterium sp. WL103]|uniref:hypothetical protein n=1 Tax=Methylobacterium sp. WL103 TaxID=2603891 RepID=UPI0011C7B683|nr:hypothetical protein [Methylobacterium sp. WL103]TXN08945.1 hypothetical protein FV222_00295 [Methylobacterium sp. WL103]